MIYSVWDHADRNYKYYETPEKSSATSAPKPMHLKPSTLGMDPEKASWPLPSNAKFIGRGKYPKGFIASPKSAGNKALGFISLDPTPMNVLVIGGIGFILWKYLDKR